MRYQELKKKIPANFVDSYHYFTWDRIFFVLSLLSTLFQAMVNNSAADIPSLFFILIMFATYMFRKTFTKIYLQYTFFVMYYLHFVLLLKLSNEILVNIDFVQSTMDEYPENKFVLINDLLFGSIKKNKPGS
jgi:hypothetical protein